MKYLENYYYVNNKTVVKELNSEIKKVLNPFYLDYIFDYKITDFNIEIDVDQKIIELSIFGYGNPIIGEKFKKEDALIKLIFEKKQNIWIVKIKRSKTFKKIQYRDTEIKMENVNLIKNQILDILKNNKKL